jgi:peptidoglycan/xylan/chitin deacetylase (PgdA/CDA1 family)
VPERYDLDQGLIHDLSQRGFEVGIHGLKHDGKLFCSKSVFMKRAERINRHLQAHDAVGFRSPLMQRNPEWLQALQIEYDLSFFDTDPYQPMPGGCMSIWPFFIGHFVELPYTLAQDCTVCTILGETTPRIWLEKLAFIESYCGMALLNTHPDYLREDKLWNMYAAFLDALAKKGDFWHALPHAAASWWRERHITPTGHETPDMVTGTIELQKDELVFNWTEFAISNRVVSGETERVEE